jgi:hypothetical protein
MLRLLFLSLLCTNALSLHTPTLSHLSLSLTLSMSLSLSLFSAVADADVFIPGRTRLLQAPANDTAFGWLFRGNDPLTPDGKAVNESAWLGQLQELANAAPGGRVVSNFSLISISLLNDVTDREEEKVETHFFDENPWLGSLWSWPMIGSLVNPVDVPEPVRRYTALHQPWTFDHIPKKVDTIAAELASVKNDTFVYIHCEAGVDRTGALSGSYLMAKHGWTFAKALATDDGIEPRKITTECKWAMQWYCYHLHYSGVKTVGDCSGG